MSDPKGSHLFVNLGASQTRRRLKGFGHGVRKIQSAGRNQAVIIHTATGKHLRELESKFADVGFANTESALLEPIENLRNLGPTSTSWLRDAGISTISELARIGPAQAYRLVKTTRPEATLNLLWALAAGLKDLDSKDLKPEEKELLREQVADISRVGE